MTFRLHPTRSFSHFLPPFLAFFQTAADGRVTVTVAWKSLHPQGQAAGSSHPSVLGGAGGRGQDFALRGHAAGRGAVGQRPP